jgi:hypothetical protein
MPRDEIATESGLSLRWTVILSISIIAGAVISILAGAAVGVPAGISLAGFLHQAVSHTAQSTSLLDRREDADECPK